MVSNNLLAVTRRGFMRAGAGSALVLALHIDSGRVAAAQDIAATFAPDAFIRVSPGGGIALVMPQVEMGQGIYTAMAMLIAEEMDVGLDDVVLEAAPPSDQLYGNPIFGVQATGGSTSIRAYWLPFRTAGAKARAMLVAAAARRWSVPASECRTENNAVLHDRSGRRLGYGDLADAAATESVPEQVALKEPADFRLIGRKHRRLDTADKVNGGLKYGIDAMPEGLKFASLKASPVPGGRLASIDEEAIQGLHGFRQILRFDDMVAVVGDHTWAALSGLELLDPQWDDGANGTLTTDSLRAGLNAAAAGGAVVVKDEGDALHALQGDGVTSMHFDFPMLAHAPMEPMNCTVHIRPDGCEIWVGTQVMTMTQRAAAEITGLPLERIVVHNHLIGGGFGRRLEVDFVRKAVRIAQQVEGPVKVIYSREEDIGNAMYRSLYGVQLSAKVEQGRPVAWRHRIVGPAIIARWLPPAFANGIDIDAVDGAAEMPYDIPKFRVEYVRHELPGFPTCFWRGVGPNVNVFAVESFIERLARDSGVDPLGFRRNLLAKHPRARAALDLAAASAGWGQDLPPRAGRGASLQFVFGSYLATVAEVAVDDDGEVRVKRLVCAVDCGAAVNPDGIVAQIQGGMVFGLSAVLYGEISIDRGRVQQSNFHDYRVVRIDEMPQIDVHLVDSAESPGGIGEPGTVAVQPAVANAVYAATGVQVTRLPIDPKLLAKVKP